ncbi:response regulator [Palleronia sp. LCG004]|uniref:response regulator n=1 Tax=Palleronia sp. LCG004 TaxID=3079304 RepID=UPI002943C8AF|nr:response regulator [Palleronia sp. LCG004]WOI56146.1 response regulator [Palleronia sp. LCG004]
MSWFSNIYSCIAYDHDIRNLAAAVLLCALGANVTFALWRQILKSPGRLRRWTLFALAVLTLTCSVWATHFVAMLGYVDGLDRRISVGWTIASIAMPVALHAGATLAVLGMSTSRRSALLAAVALTLAATGMHYTGVQAFRESALLLWQPSYVVMSIIGGVIANYGAMRAFTNREGLGKIFVGAGYYSLSIVCLHFLGMTALTLVPLGESQGAMGSAPWLSRAIFGAVMVVLLGGTSALVVDRLSLRRQLAEAARLKRLTRELRVANAEALEANAALIRARDLAEEATRSKSRFFAMMNHELRTPLNGVLGMAEALAETEMTPDQSDCVWVIRSSGHALMTILNDILSMSKLDQSAEMQVTERVDLRDLLEEVVAGVAGHAEGRRLGLHLKVAPGAPSGIVGDGDGIRKIVTHLVNGAIRSTDAGHVIVELGDGGGATRGMTLHVHDMGADGGERAADGAFGRAGRAQAQRQDGSRLCLAIAGMLAGHLQGAVTVRPRAEGGSTYTFSLPCEHWMPEREAAPGAGAAIAVLAPDEVERAILIDMLREADARPVVVAPGAAVLPAEVRGVVLGRGAELPAGGAWNRPVLRIVAPDEDATGTADLPAETRAPRPLRRAALGRWLADPVPRAAEAEDGATRPVAVPVEAGRILVVDDSGTNRLVLKRLLGGRAATIVEAADGVAACNEVEAQNFTHILMDVAMPRMDGLEATARIRARERQLNLAHVPIIGITAHAFDEDRQLCLRAGMDEVVTKPVSKATLDCLLTRWSGAAIAEASAA